MNIHGFLDRPHECGESAGLMEGRTVSQLALNGSRPPITVGSTITPSYSNLYLTVHKVNLHMFD